ncbi:MAG: carbohydrate ABC transporter permease [Bifidobacterium sp.]
MILFIGAMMSIDSTLYEAAEIDGANRWQQFKHIILPGIKTILVLNVILSITGSLSAFEGPYVITSGANGTATYFVRMDRLAHTSQRSAWRPPWRSSADHHPDLRAAAAVVLQVRVQDADDGVEKAGRRPRRSSASAPA